MENPTATLDVEDGLATLRLQRNHGNAINPQLIDDLVRACYEIERRPEIRGVLFAASGKLFCPGLDLQELIELDRHAMDNFFRKFNACMLALYGLCKPMVVAIHGHAVAGGCVLALTADRRILRRGALIGLNEVRVGVPLPYGVAQLLRETVHRTSLEEVALFGRNYADEAALAVGLAHELLPAEGFEAACRQRLVDLASRDTLALGVTKRHLRQFTIDRVRAVEDRMLPDFLDGWFRETTQARIREIVAGLTRGGGPQTG